MYKRISSTILFFLIPLCLLGQLKVQGSITGSNDESLKSAYYHISGPNNFLIQKEINSDGSFSIYLSERGGYEIDFLGVQHQTISIPVIVEEKKSVKLNVRMEAMQFQKDLDSIYVIGNFNNYSTEEGGILMQKGNDGSFYQKINTQSDSISYQLLGVAQTKNGKTHPIAGNDADTFLPNYNRESWKKGGHFFTVKNVPNDSATITFNPGSLPHAKTTQRVSFSDSILNGITALFQDVEMMEENLSEAFGKSIESFQNLLKSYQDKIKSRIKTEENEKLRQWALMRYFDELVPSEADSGLANQLLEEVPPTSPFWSYKARYSYGISNILWEVIGSSNQFEMIDEYINEAIEQHQDKDARAQFLYIAYHRAEQDEDRALMSEFYYQLEKDHSDSEHYKELRKEFDPERKIQAGNSIPEFKLVLLQDENKFYTNDNFKEKIYLIDFWGTWCGPCIEELPYLHKAYEKYKNKNFEILSVAMLDEKDNIKEFREERYPMPWNHAFVKKENTEQIRDLFEIVGYPRPILINSKGEIIALDEQLRGSKLLNRLQNIFDK